MERGWTKPEEDRRVVWLESRDVDEKTRLLEGKGLNEEVARVGP